MLIVDSFGSICSPVISFAVTLAGTSSLSLSRGHVDRVVADGLAADDVTIDVHYVRLPRRGLEIGLREHFLQARFVRTAEDPQRPRFTDRHFLFRRIGRQLFDFLVRYFQRHRYRRHAGNDGHDVRLAGLQGLDPAMPLSTAAIDESCDL